MLFPWAAIETMTIRANLYSKLFGMRLCESLWESGSLWKRENLVETGRRDREHCNCNGEYHVRGMVKVY